MSFLNWRFALGPKQTASKLLSTVVAVSLMMALIGQSQVQAQIGPEAPPPKAPPENSVGKALSKWLKGTKKPDTAKTKTQTNLKPGLTKDDNLIMDANSANTPPQDTQTPQPTAPPESSVKHPPLLVQPPLDNVKIDRAMLDNENPPVLNHPKLDDPRNPLGFADAEIKLKKLSALTNEKRYAEAKPGLTQLRQNLVELTEAHIGLYKTLNQLPSARGQAELEKELALEFAQLRDRTMVEYAKIYIAEHEYNKAVKELTDVVKSQPRSKVGLRAYELLQEIGFTEKLQITQ
jgi:hypothetical protein